MANNKKRKHSTNTRNVKKEAQEVQQTVTSASKPKDERKMIIRIGMLILALIMALGAVLPLFF
ncbi:MAG: hypothetical protein GXY08_14035 [Ruminococcus sp.]|nr:hypothetical protein [Ruminococcus sp.]